MGTEPIKISDNHVVHYHYTLKNDEGETLQSSYEDQAMVYLHGHRNIIPGLEKAMEGQSIGNRFNVTIPPEDAFGFRKENSVERIPVKHLKGAKKWKVGMAAFVETKQGYQQVQIIKLGRFMVDVDLNHPFADLTLHYDVEIIDIREAKQDEIAHGHVHES